MADVPPKPDAPAGAPPLQFTMDDAVSNGVYINFANIVHNAAEFVIDFGRIVPGRPDVRVLSRVLTSPLHAKQLLNALSQNITLYEKSFGPIKTEFGPPPASPPEPVRPN